jgi:hypothetical protein
MKRKWLIITGTIILCPILVILSFLIFQKPVTLLKVNGKVSAVATRFFIAPILTDGSVNVRAGKENFSLWEDFFDSPIFIYPFADGKRFLCDYDDDTSMLDFVVDFRDSATNELRSSGWPPNDKVMGDYLRTYMASRITNVVFNTKGFVRLPNYSELQEVYSYLKSTTPTPTKAGYFYLLNFGEKEGLLLDLATNRQSAWPTEK